MNMEWTGGTLLKERAVLWPSQNPPHLFELFLSLAQASSPYSHGTQMTYRLLTGFCQYYNTHWLSYQLKSGGSKPARLPFLFSKIACLSDSIGKLVKMQILWLLP